MLNFLLRRGPFALIVLASYWLALFTATHVPRQMVQMGVGYSDKLAHFSGYAILAFLLTWCIPMLGQRVWTRYAAVMSIALIYGALDELMQLLVPGRQADVFDWLADGAGAIAGIAIYLLAKAVIIQFVWRVNVEKQQGKV